MKKKMKKVSRVFLNGMLVVAIALAMSGVYLIPQAKAAALTLKSDTMSRLQATTVSDHQVDFKTPTGVHANGITITIDFDTFTTVSSNIVFGDVDLEIDASCDGTYEISKTLAGTAAAGTWGVSTATTVLTLTSPTDATTDEIAADSCVRVEVGTNATGGTNQITNPAASTPTISIGGTFGDTGDLLVSIETDDSVNVTATVAETINFAISDVEIGFGSLTSANARFATSDAVGSDSDSAAAHTLTVGTNASGGYSVTYNGPTLTNGASDTIDVASVTDDADGTPGSEEFGVGFSVSDDATVATGYDHNATPASRDWAFVASTTTEVVSETVPSADETISAFYLANIETLTEAGDYETDITYVMTATY